MYRNKVSFSPALGSRIFLRVERRGIPRWRCCSTGTGGTHHASPGKRCSDAQRRRWQRRSLSGDLFLVGRTMSLFPMCSTPDSTNCRARIRFRLLRKIQSAAYFYVLHGVSCRKPGLCPHPDAVQPAVVGTTTARCSARARAEGGGRDERRKPAWDLASPACPLSRIGFAVGSSWLLLRMSRILWSG